MRHINLKSEKFTFTTRNNANAIYIMRPDHLNRTAIFDQQGRPVTEGGLRCIIWLLRNHPEIVSLWNGNQLEGTLTFA